MPTDLIIVAQKEGFYYWKVYTRYLNLTGLRGVGVTMSNVNEFLRHIINEVKQDTIRIIVLGHPFRPILMGLVAGGNVVINDNLPQSQGLLSAKSVQASRALWRSARQKLRGKYLFLIGFNTASPSQSSSRSVGKLFAKAGAKTYTVVGSTFCLTNGKLAFGFSRISGNTARVYTMVTRGPYAKARAHIYETLHRKIANPASNFMKE